MPTGLINSSNSDSDASGSSAVPPPYTKERIIMASSLGSRHTDVSWLIVHSSQERAVRCHSRLKLSRVSISERSCSAFSLFTGKSICVSTCQAIVSSKPATKPYMKRRHFTCRAQCREQRRRKLLFDFASERERRQCGAARQRSAYHTNLIRKNLCRCHSNESMLRATTYVLQFSQPRGCIRQT